MKKNGGVITQWQFHTLGSSEETLAKARRFHPTFNMDVACVLTGTVQSDPTGRWQPGNHMRSSLILNYCAETGVVETKNTIYTIMGKQGDPVLGGMDIGLAALSLFY